MNYSQAKALEEYRAARIKTARPLDLVVMLYDGALRNLARANSALKQQDIEGANNALLRCQDILQELMVTLNLESGEIARNLHRLYEYMLHRLVEANIHKTPTPVVEVARLLASLREAWVQIAGAPPQEAAQTVTRAANT